MWPYRLAILTVVAALQPRIDATTESGAPVLSNNSVDANNRVPLIPEGMDMLGFGALVRKHPGSFNIEISEDGSTVGTSTSQSSERFGRFHAVLDRMTMDHMDASRPERMMIFSDCAFGVYDNALQAAVSLSQTMRNFLKWSIPVRMCIAKGTCHHERFSIEWFQSFNLTRSMFYGSGVVFAVEGEEENAGSGCRIFLHTSLEVADRAQIEKRVTMLPLPDPSANVQYELNYLHEPDGTGETDPEKDDIRLWAGLLGLRSELREPIPPKILAQDDESFAPFNRMRQRLGRYEIRPPKF
jgi:hypothetical protein